jgi:hypothetical protein
MHMGPVFFLTLLAQQQASVGLGAGVVRYAGGSSFSALTLSPAAQWSSASTFVGASGGLSLLEGGVWAGQGRVDLWGTLPWRVRQTRFAVSSMLAASSRSDGVPAASALVVPEAVTNRFALGAGFITGVIEHQPGVSALRLRGRTWWQLQTSPTQLSLTTEATHLLGIWYADVIGGLTFDGARTVGSVWLTARFNEAYKTTGAASVAVQYFLTPSIAVEGSAGNYLRDPFQGLPRAGFVSGGVRWFAAPRPTVSVVTSEKPLLYPLTAFKRGADTAVVRFRMTGAHAVAIAGSWNEWKPDALKGLGDDIWEGALRLPTGTYYFNLIVDGTEWVVPAGIATIADNMGGQLAVLIVP